MSYGAFDPKDLEEKDWEFAVELRKASDFWEGETVFLKSSPEQKLTVTCVNQVNNTVEAEWPSELGMYSAKFEPTCLLPIKYAPLRSSRNPKLQPVSFN